jgi:hypothetical protein
MATVS